MSTDKAKQPADPPDDAEALLVSRRVMRSGGQKGPNVHYSINKERHRKGLDVDVLDVN
jgi:hypothetical protein